MMNDGKTELLYQDRLLIRKALERYADPAEAKEAERLEQLFKDASKITVEVDC